MDGRSRQSENDEVDGRKGIRDRIRERMGFKVEGGDGRRRIET